MISEFVTVVSLPHKNRPQSHDGAAGVEKNIIADKVGVSKATLYRYLVYKGIFDTKSEKFLETNIFY